LCLGFLQGVNSTFGFVGDEIKNETKFCAPDRMANGQLVRVVVKYLTDNPKKLHLPQTGLVWFALQDAYPCK
jgi:hypothetical protein